MSAIKHQISSFIARYYWPLIIFLFVFLRIPTLFEPYWYGDEGIYLALGQAIRKGLLLYTQAHDNKPPTLYLLAAVSQTVFGFRLLLLLVMIPTLYYFYKLSLYFLSPVLSKIALFIFLILSSIPFIEGTIANAEVFMLLPTILAVYLFLVSNSRFKFLVSGLLLGLAFTIKVPVFAEIAFLALWLLITPGKLVNKIVNLIVFGISSLIPIFLFAIYYFFFGSLYDFAFAALLQNFGYLSSWTTGNHQSSFLQGGLFFRTVVLFITWFVLFLLRYRQIFKDKYLFIIFWFSATIYASLLSARPYPHYLIQVLPPLCLLIAALYLPKARYIKAVVLTSLIVFLSLVFKYKFYFYPVFSYYRNFYGYVLGQKDAASYTRFFGDRVLVNNQISSYIKANSTDSDFIFVWGDEPYIYPLSQRLTAGRFLVAYHIVDFNRYQETMNQLKAKFPKFIVIYPMTNRPFDELDNFIEKYYFPVQVFDKTIIVYQRR